MNTVFLLLGGNTGGREQILNKTFQLINQKIGKIIKSSSIYETEPWGFVDENLFLNQLLCVETKLEPNLLLSELLNIEKSLGRKRKKNRWGSRIIDIDILFYNDEIIKEENLIIPHSLLHKRMFTLVPLSEIASNFVHPVFNKSIKELLNECKDTLKVQLYKRRDL